MSHINESDLQFPDTGNDGAHDEHPDDLTSFDSSTLMFPSVGDADEPRQTPPAQPPQPPAKQRRKAKSAAATPDEPAAQTGRTAQPTQTGHTEAGDGFDLPVWGAGVGTAADAPPQLFPPAAAAHRKLTGPLKKKYLSLQHGFDT